MANPVVHFEIMGTDSARLQKFYRDVFNWKLTPPMADMGNYSLLEGHEPGIGGGLGEGDARVSIYVAVDDPQRYLDRAVAAGATLLMPVTTITPTTTIAMFRDPAGNVNGILKDMPRPATAPKAKARKKTTARKSTARRATGRKSTARKTTARRRTARRSGRR